MPNFPILVSAVAFDLDGTLVDTLPDLHEAANRMLGDLGRSKVDDCAVRAYVGDGVDRLVKRLLIGDSPNDTRAARAAGCPVFCVPYGYRGTLVVHELDCDAIVPSLLDSMKLVEIPRS
jgi:phosphoglycolate phosphatase-like HAD superfamily hydrolase